MNAARGALLFTLFLPFVASAQFEALQEAAQDEMTAGFYTGNRLYEMRGTVQFVTYILGVHDASKARLTFCTPRESTGRQLADVVEKYLRDNPGVRDRQAHQLVRDALVVTWPCSAPQRSR